MKKICFMILIVSIAVARGYSAELRQYVPKNTEILFHCVNLDAKQAWHEIISLCRQKLAQHNDPDRMLLSYIFRQFKFKEICGGYFKKDQLNNNILLIKPKLDGQGEQFNRFLIENLGNFVALDQNWHKKEVAGKAVYFDVRGEKNETLTSFCVQDGQVVMASNSGLVATCLETNKKQNSIKTDTLFKELIGKIPIDYDGLIFINNQNRKFSQDLKKWEADNKIVLLMSSQWLESLLLVFTLVADDSIKGKLIFKCSDPAKLKLMQNDAEFLGEVIKRKYAYSKLVYKNDKVSMEGNSVILDFTANNFKVILDKEL